jgi:hypothetical protein
MLSPARAIVLVAALSVLLVSTGARAQDAGVRAQDGGAVQMADGDVDVRLVGPDDPELRDSIRELLARLHLTVAPAGATTGGSSSRVASVQIDLSSPSEALLTVTDAATGEARLRRSVPRDASAAIVREEIAHAVQSAVEAALLAARERAAKPPSPPPPPAPAVSVTPPPLVSRPTMEQPHAIAPPSTFGLEVATLAGISPIADDSGLATRIGVSASLVSRVFLHPSLALEFLYAVPFDTVDQVLSINTSIASLRALPGIGLFHGRWLAVDLGAGGGVDIVTVYPRAELGGVTVNGPNTSIDRILSAMLTVHVALSGGVVALVSAGVDMDLDSRQYVLAQGASQSSVLEPWRFRPMVLAGFGFAALGDGVFPVGGGHR